MSPLAPVAALDLRSWTSSLDPLPRLESFDPVSLAVVSALLLGLAGLVLGARVGRVYSRGGASARIAAYGILFGACGAGHAASFYACANSEGARALVELSPGADRAVLDDPGFFARAPHGPGPTGIPGRDAARVRVHRLGEQLFSVEVRHPDPSLSAGLLATHVARQGDEVRALAEPVATTRSRRRQLFWSLAAGLGACAVGLFWGRWLEGSSSAPTSKKEEPEEDDEERRG